MLLLAIACLVPFRGELQADDPPPRTGVTILVHGLVLLDGETNDPLEYWGAENVADLLRRFGRGQVWLYNPNTRRFDDISDKKDAKGNFLIPHEADDDPDHDDDLWKRDPTGEQVLLFDWGDGSGEKEAGQAEAAADELFAALLAFEVEKNEPIISLTPPIALALRPMHFIGHSRGTVVTSETVQRLGRNNVPVSYVTYLDPHDFAQKDITRDQFFHDPAVQVWHNVDRADCFYQRSEVVCINPWGRGLAHIPLGELQRDLTNLKLFDTCDEKISPHARVREYYWATVACNAGKEPDRPERPEAWFAEGNKTGRGFGFDLWLTNGGYDQPRNERIYRIDAGMPGAAIEYNTKDDRGDEDRNDPPPIIFNGDFDLPDLDGSIGGAVQSGTLAGWWYYGGGGEATIRLSGGNHSLELTRGKFESRTVVAIHNRFYLPKTASEIRFAYWGRHVPPTGDHTLDVLIGNRIIRSFTVAATSGFEARTASLSDDQDLLGGANTLTFRLNTNRPPLQSAVVRLDNISIFEGRTIVRMDSIKHGPEGGFLLDWRSWPPRSYQLEAALNGLTGPWVEIGGPMKRASSGPTAVDHPGVPAAFFRLKLVP